MPIDRCRRDHDAVSGRRIAVDLLDECRVSPRSCRRHARRAAADALDDLRPLGAHYWRMVGGRLA